MPRRHVGIGAPSWINWKEWDIIYDHGPRKVWKLRDELILKRVPWDINSEAVTHKFLYENTSIPIPRVHDEWLSPDRVYYYLLEGYIEGVTLADCWPRLTRQQKCDLAREVTGYMLKLSKFEGAAMQSVSGERLPNNNFVPKVSRSHLSGRWRTDAEIFNNEFYPALRNAGVDRATIETLQRMMPPCQSELVLTHCDLYVGNVMVCPSTAQVTAIIDWESCGFWPKWFQYARMTHGCSRDDSEWKELLSRAHKDIIPFAAEGRVWWDVVHTLMYVSNSLRARAWLKLLVRFGKGEICIRELERYYEIDEGRAREQAHLEQVRLNGYGQRGVGGYYSSVVGGSGDVEGRGVEWFGDKRGRS